MNITSSMLQRAAIGTGITGTAVMLGNAFLPKEGQDSQVLSAKTGKEATVFGAVAAIALEHKSAPFAGGMVAGVIAGDIASTLIGSPHVGTYGADKPAHEDEPVPVVPAPYVMARPIVAPPWYGRPVMQPNMFAPPPESMYS